MDVYVTADDFGRDPAVNAAVQQAHVSGVLNGASLMVTGAAWRDAVERARELPDLQVGLHLVLSDGLAVLPPKAIPHLVNRRGEFRRSPARAGLRYWCDPRARAELKQEIEAQFRRFAETGLRLSHVDGHQHLHLHPVVFDLLLPEAERWGAARIRIPRDDLRLALKSDRTRLVAKFLTTCTFRLLEWRARRRMRGSTVYAVPRTYGLMRTGDMQESYVRAILEQLPATPAEIYFHPTTAGLAEPLGPNRTDFETLMSPRIRELMRGRSMGGRTVSPGVVPC